MDQEKLFALAIEKCASSRETVTTFLALSENDKEKELRTSGRKIFAAFAHIYNCLGFGTKKVYAPCTDLWHQVKNLPSPSVRKIVQRTTSAQT